MAEAIPKLDYVGSGQTISQIYGREAREQQLADMRKRREASAPIAQFGGTTAIEGAFTAPQPDTQEQEGIIGEVAA